MRDGLQIGIGFNALSVSESGGGLDARKSGVITPDLRASRPAEFCYDWGVLLIKRTREESNVYTD